MSKEVRVKLTATDFDSLINGKICYKNSNNIDVAIILEDIGYDLMQCLLDRAKNNL